MIQIQDICVPQDASLVWAALVVDDWLVSGVPVSLMTACDVSLLRIQQIRLEGLSSMCLSREAPSGRVRVDCARGFTGRVGGGPITPGPPLAGISLVWLHAAARPRLPHALACHQGH